MCFPYLESSPPRRPKPRRPPISIPDVDVMGGNGMQNGPRAMIQGIESGQMPGKYNTQGDNTRYLLPHDYPARGQLPLCGNGLLGYGGLNAQRQQPYVRTPGMVYAMPNERRSLSAASLGDVAFRYSGDMGIRGRSGRGQRYPVNEGVPVVIFQASTGRERSRTRSRGRGRRRHYYRRRPSVYFDGRWDSTSTDTSVHGYRRPVHYRGRSI